jgi:hypothetical protein
VWYRTDFDGIYYHLSYGQQSIRVLPSMWHRVKDEGLRIGDRIEVRDQFHQNEPCLGKIVEMRWDKPSGRILYTIETRELVLPRQFYVDDLIRLNEKTQLRESDFARSIEPDSSSLES